MDSHGKENANAMAGNPFHYVTELQKHASELAAVPADWMPWNYLATLESGQGCHGG
ncbi:MAG: hypothetical protein NTU53_18505 [Planctomycetota bacterium]|nr:hypothetical protein [Planctomycetota bacterium]